MGAEQCRFTGIGILATVLKAPAVVSTLDDVAVRFMQLMSHHLVESTVCSPAAGLEKGQVENQVGILRWRFFKPSLKFKTYEELNA